MTECWHRVSGTTDEPNLSDTSLLPTDGCVHCAWAAATAALPEYWRIRSLIETPGPKVGWEVVAADARRIVTAAGPTPAAALEALAAELTVRLRERQG